jgi:hypothetical protein
MYKLAEDEQVHADGVSGLEVSQVSRQMAASWASRWTRPSLDQVQSSERVIGSQFSKCEQVRAGQVSRLNRFGSGGKGFPLHMLDSLNMVIL